jgi:hypothetical protein
MLVTPNAWARSRHVNIRTFKMAVLAEGIHTAWWVHSKELMATFQKGAALSVRWTMTVQHLPMMVQVI